MELVYGPGFSTSICRSFRNGYLYRCNVWCKHPKKVVSLFSRIRKNHCFCTLVFLIIFTEICNWIRYIVEIIFNYFCVIITKRFSNNILLAIDVYNNVYFVFVVNTQYPNANRLRTFQLVYKTILRILLKCICSNNNNNM